MPPHQPKMEAPQSIGRYDIISLIAEGGMGSVFKARDRDSGDIVAVKIVQSEAAKNPTLLKRFEREFLAARALEHPHIVRAIDFDASGPAPFLVMELVDGESVGDRIDRTQRIPEDEAIRIIAQIGTGLYRAHKQGIIHRDVKPDNILLTADGTAKLADLGLVRDMGDDFNLTRTGRGLGTPHFMAPEQFRDAKGADVRCDIYSLGATLYMMVTGVQPFGNCSALDCFLRKTRNEYTPPREIVSELSERIDWAIQRAMSADPAQRPATCREFIEDLLGRSTRPQQVAERKADGDVWYLVYKDEAEELHTAKGNTETIRKAIKEGLLGDASNVTACRQKTGPFVPLQNFPEFRDLIIIPSSMSNAPGQASGKSGVKSPAPSSKSAGSANDRFPAQRNGDNAESTEDLVRVPAAAMNYRARQPTGGGVLPAMLGALLGTFGVIAAIGAAYAIYHFLIPH